MESNKQAAERAVRQARFCEIKDEELKTDGRKVHTVTWDSTKIQNGFSDAEQQDALLHFNIVTGTIITGKLWPLIFDHSDDPLVEKRTIAFMKRVAHSPQLLKQLDEHQARHFFVGVRDLWLAESRGSLSADERQTLSAVLEQLDDEFVPHGEHQSLSFSFCPSKHRRVLKFIEHLNVLGDFDDQLLESIATMTINTAIFYAVWVDAADLSYNNFESILPLDRALHLGDQMGKDLPLMEFTLDSITRPNKQLEVVKCQLKGPGTKSLLALDTLGLYQMPANSSTRGGQRFIFSSAVLSRGLTTAIKGSNLLKVLTRPQSTFHERTFESVNYVFRCNKFAPGDHKFEMHMDTPYYDSVKKHVSKYTMLIYLSDGTGKPALKIESATERGVSMEINSVSTFDCVIFNHRYPHEGQPFIDSDKIFLRTELIFTDRHMESEPGISKFFSSAVYFTLQSAFQPDYARHAHELYERVNKAHWRLNDDTQSQRFEPIVLHKCWNGLHFATNGNDYWFPHVTAENNTPQAMNDQQRVQYLKLIAVIAVLDYFNCRYGERVENNNVMKTFRKECSSEQLSVPHDVESTTDWIMSYLWKHVASESKHGDYFRLTNVTQKEDYLTAALPLYQLKDGEEADQCCPMCDRDFIPWKCTYTLNAYKREVERNMNNIKASPVIFLNNQLQFDPASILLDEDKIHFHTIDGEIACNFAGCWNSHLTDQFFGDEELIDAPRFTIPPISFVPVRGESHGPGFRLLMDFFNNDWAMPREGDIERKVSVPNFRVEPTDWDTASKRVVDPYTDYSDDGYYQYDEEDE